MPAVHHQPAVPTAKPIFVMPSISSHVLPTRKGFLCLQSDASLQSAQLAHETASEPGDWGRGMQGREGHSGGNSQVSSPHVQMSETSKNHQEWVRLMQQRELDLRHREVRRPHLPPPPFAPLVFSLSDAMERFMLPGRTMC